MTIIVCDAYHRNPTVHQPYLNRCRRHARQRLTLQTPTDIITLNRCQLCSDELAIKEAAGATFGILAVEAVQNG